jgi:hypothetical protein
MAAARKRICTSHSEGNVTDHSDHRGDINDGGPYPYNYT